MIIQDLPNKLSALPNQSTNVTSALNRIKSLRNYLSEIGNSSNLNLGLTSSSTLEEVVIAYNKIVLLSPAKNTTVGTGGITFLPGYYKEEFTVSGEVDSSVADELAALKTAIKTAATNGFTTNPNDVLAGAYTVQVTENEDGTLSLSKVAGTAGSSSNPFTAKGSEGAENPTLTLGSGTKTLSTDIAYHPGGEKEVKVEVYEAAGETVAVAELLGSGYYANPIKIVPVFLTGESTNKAINVEANKEIIISHAGETDLIPSTDFDFIKDGKIKVAPGESKVTAKLSGDTVILTPSTTKGWVETTEVAAGENTSLTEELDGSFVIKIPAVTASEGTAISGKNDVDNDGKDEVVVKPSAGYYDGNTAIKLVTSDGNDVEVLTESNISILEGEDGGHVIVVPAGMADTTITKTITESEISFGGSTEGDIPSVTLNTQATKLSTSEGYTSGEEKVLVVKDASDPILATVPALEWTGTGSGDKVVVKISEAGWLNAGETDITDSFVDLANIYVANNLVDNTGGVDAENAPEAGQAVFTYADNLDEVNGGIQFKVPTSGKYFASAKVDLSALITEIDNI